MRLFIVLLLYAGVVLGDFVPVVKAGKKGEIWAYSVLLSVTFCVLVLYSLDVRLPNPSRLIEDLVGPLTGGQKS